MFTDGGRDRARALRQLSSTVDCSRTLALLPAWMRAYADPTTLRDSSSLIGFAYAQ
jgi:hypothetical protein